MIVCEAFRLWYAVRYRFAVKGRTMEKEEERSIDLGRLARVAWSHKIPVAAIIVVCTLVAFIYSMFLPKEYSSTTVVQTRGASALSGGAAAALAALGGGSSSATTQYIELMKSRAVVNPVIDEMDFDPENKLSDEKEKEAKERTKISPGGWVKKHLDIKNTKGTSLIAVTGKGSTPEEAQKISQGVVENFLRMQTEKSKETQSLLVKFLNDRIETAKTEADEANAKFAQYQKEHQVYSPEEQSKIVIAKMNAFDDEIGKMEVQKRASQAKLDAAQSKLGEVNAGSLQYNVNDNSTVQSIRSQIVSKEVELVGLRQQYTEKHPSVIAAEKQLSDLQQSLESEVAAVVSSKAATVNPTQSALMQDAAQAQAAIAVADASRNALQKRAAQKQAEYGDLPDEIVEYMQLKRDSEIKNEIYTNLVKQCEQDKIQEAMESMDIQIIDEAPLPMSDMPSGPNVKLITAVGFVAGVLIAFGFSLLLYRREEY